MQGGTTSTQRVLTPFGGWGSSSGAIKGRESDGPNDMQAEMSKALHHTEHVMVILHTQLTHIQ